MRHIFQTVVQRRVGFRLFTVPQLYGDLCSRVGQFSDGLIHRHGLGARNDAFYTGEIRIPA